MIIYGRVTGQTLPQWQKVFRILPEGNHSDATQVLMPGVPPSRSRSTANSQSKDQTLPVPLCIQELVLGDAAVEAEVPAPGNLPAAFGASGSPAPPASKTSLPQAPTPIALGWVWKAAVAALAAVGIGLGAYFLWPQASEPEPASMATPQTLSS